MLKELNAMKVGKEINECEFNHILSILLRTYNEIEYMKRKNKIIDHFTLEQMENLKITKIKEIIKIDYKEEQLTLTVNQLQNISEDIYNYFNKKYPIHYDYRKIDPIYLSLFLYAFLPNIKKVKLDEVFIDDFKLLRRNSNPVTLEESESYKALKLGKECKVYTPFNSNHIVDSDYERLMESVNSIKEHGYPYLEQYIILYNDEFYIRDGQHRASVLKYLYGNIKVPVLRIYIEGDLHDNE